MSAGARRSASPGSNPGNEGAACVSAWVTPGGGLFEDFLRQDAFKLSLDLGPKAKNAVAGRAAVRELEKFRRNPIQC